MNKRIIFSIIAIIFLLSANITFSQKERTDALIIGHVKNNGDHIPYATVLLKGTSIGTSTDFTGHYQLTNLPVGTFTLRAQAIGYKAQEKEVKIEKDKTLEVNFNLTPDVIMTEEVVVTASRYAQTRKEAPVVVNRISPKIFIATESPTLSEGLNFTPGLRMEDDCQNCGFSQLRMNGLDGAYSQILIDSRPIFSSLAGVYGLEMLPANMIDRVEVVRGGGSALYGANAIAGTVNIITKEPLNNSYQVGNNLGLIDFEKADASINFSTTVVSDDYRSGIFTYGMFRYREPYNANPDDLWDSNDDGRPDKKDDFSEITKLKSSVFGLKSYFRPGDYDKITFDFNLINDYRRGGNQFDRKPDQSDITEMVRHLILNSGLTYDAFTKNQKNKFTAYVSAQKVTRDSYYGAERDPSAYGKTKGFTWVVGSQCSKIFEKILFAPSTLILGAENIHDQLKDEKLGYYEAEDSKYIPSSVITDQFVNTVGLFAQNEWDFDWMKALIGFRYDYSTIKNKAKEHDEKNSYDNISPRVNLLFNLKENLQFRTSYARGFRVPQIFDEDLHVESSGARKIIHINDPNLKPETSNNIAAGFDYSFKIGKLPAEIIIEGFYTKLDNAFAPEYDFDDTTKIMTITRVNASSYALVSGVNLEFKIFPIKTLDVQLGLTVQSAKYNEDQEWGEETENVSKHILRTPTTYGYFIANWNPTKKFSAVLSGTYTGSMYAPHYPGGYHDNELIDTETLEKTCNFMDIGIKLSYDFHIAGNTILKVNCGLKNIFNSYQNDFDAGIGRDAGYIYGSKQARTIFFGFVIANNL